jgi:hypothetical protein
MENIKGGDKVRRHPNYQGGYWKHFCMIENIPLNYIFTCERVFDEKVFKVRGHYFSNSAFEKLAPKLPLEYYLQT